MNEKKELKKQYKKAKKKYITLWKSLSIFTVIIALLAGIMTTVTKIFDNSMAVFVGGEFYELENEDSEAVYYSSDFDTEKEMGEYGSKLCEQVEAEGVVLLTNENNALPLKEDSKVSCFSTSSVNPVYGGSGSAAIDTSKAKTLKDVLTDVGFSVNEKLWNFYLEGAGAEYSRPQAGLLPIASEVCEAPWSIYTDKEINDDNMDKE